MLTKDLPVDQATDIIHKAIRPEGILALAEDAENYQRVWARDASIAGIAGLLQGDELIIQALKNSLITLANHQAKTGAIPSNVIPGSGKTSYGSLAGRVDATTWWLIAAAIYYRESNDQDFYQKVYPKVIKAFEILDAWEFNERHLIYTPLSGNWADEYPLHGYLLYDNCLRLWALRAWASLTKNPQLIEKSKWVTDSIVNNFWPSSGASNLYHPKLEFDQNQKFWLAGFHPGGPYSGIFDAAGNAFACLLGLATDQQSRHIFEYLQAISVQLGKKLIPAFWPVISEEDPRWLDLAHNYAYHFKNAPHHFHNGGAWPVMSGWLILALRQSGFGEEMGPWVNELIPYLEDGQQTFPEYIDTQYFKAGGKSRLCFSAAGCLLAAQSQNDTIKYKLCLL